MNILQSIQEVHTTLHKDIEIIKLQTSYYQQLLLKALTLYQQIPTYTDNSYF